MKEQHAWTVILADDHPVMLRGLRELIDGHPSFSVVATLTDGDSAIAAIRREQPDLAVLDIFMPKRTGFGVLRAMGRDHGRTRFVVLTASLSDECLREAISLGVNGIVLKDAPAESLLDCFLQVAKGGRWIGASLAQRAASARPTIGNLESLTVRELEIVRLVAEGRPNKNIADRIAVSEGTVKIHLHNIYQKLGVTNRTALAAVAFSRQHSV